MKILVNVRHKNFAVGPCGIDLFDLFFATFQDSTTEKSNQAIFYS